MLKNILFLILKEIMKLGKSCHFCMINLKYFKHLEKYKKSKEILSF